MSSWLLAHPLFTKKVISKLFLGSLLDFSPPLVFIVLFELTMNFFTATFWFMVVTCIVALFARMVEKRTPYFSLYISLVTVLFGAFTLFFHNPEFLQIRDTLYDLVLGITLFAGLRKGKLFFKSAFTHSIRMADEAWRSVTLAWIYFFVVGAIGNEIARNVLTDDGWVFYKLVVLVLTFFFGIWCLFYFYKPEPEIKTDKTISG